MDGKAEGDDKYVAREKVAGKVWSDQVLHQSGNGKESGDGEKKCEGELEK